jgi:hypothetical protein
VLNVRVADDHLPHDSISNLLQARLPDLFLRAVEGLHSNTNEKKAFKKSSGENASCPPICRQRT